MTKTQLDNLIRFCFNFHASMDSKVSAHSPDYLLEKWNKYIGVTPIPDESISYNTIKNRTLKTLGDNTELVLNNWLFTWDRKDGRDYDKVKEIIKFISVLNTKQFIPPIGQYDINGNILGVTNSKSWSPGEIVEEFKLHIGDPNKINKEPYRHLHTLVKLKIDEWLDYTENKRDYKLCTLVQ